VPAATRRIRAAKPRLARLLRGPSVGALTGGAAFPSQGLPSRNPWSRARAPLAGTAPCASKEPWIRVPDVESQSITDAVGCRVSRCGGAALSMNAPLGSRRDAPIDQAAGQARPLPGRLSGSA